MKASSFFLYDSWNSIGNFKKNYVYYVSRIRLKSKENLLDVNNNSQ